ncbi:unnamed protein product, partial [Choristocarpus tenellus]
ANQVTRKSTATLVVEIAKGIVQWGGWGWDERRKGGSAALGLDRGAAEFACTASCSHGHKKCVVCHLLTRDQPPPSRKRME